MVRFTLKATDYMRKLDGDAMVGVSCLVRAQETQQVFTAQDKVSVDLPDLHIQVCVGCSTLIFCEYAHNQVLFFS